jgi:UDP-4-amino-4,6-dideoxy-N-acetyl-beta-L-altrosamine N-acetyltransferase
MKPIHSDIALDFLDITDIDDVMSVLKIRNEPAIRNNMYTDHVIQPDEHLGWIRYLKTSRDAIFFAVRYEGQIVGGVGLSSINTLHKRADWAFYLSEKCQGMGLGSALEKQFLDMAFSEYDLEKINCEVISFNKKVVDMHKRFGFVVEGTRRNHVVRDGDKYDVILLGITKDEWHG